MNLFATSSIVDTILYKTTALFVSVMSVLKQYGLRDESRERQVRWLFRCSAVCFCRLSELSLTFSKLADWLFMGWPSSLAALGRDFSDRGLF